MGRPKRSKVTAEEMAPLISSTLDELQPFVDARFKGEFANALPGDATELLELDLGEEAGEIADYRRTGKPHLARAAMIRVAARCVALLVLDERTRGEKVIEAEAVHLDALGFFPARTG